MNKEDKNKDNNKITKDIENDNNKNEKKENDNVMIELPDWNLEPPVDDKDDRGEI